MAPNTTIKAVTTTSLAYATYLAAVCPCRKELSCHLPQFFGSIGVAVFLVLMDNGYVQATTRYGG